MIDIFIFENIDQDGYSVHLFALEHRYYGESYPGET